MKKISHNKVVLLKAQDYSYYSNYTDEAVPGNYVINLSTYSGGSSSDYFDMTLKRQYGLSQSDILDSLQTSEITLVLTGFTHPESMDWFQRWMSENAEAIIWERLKVIVVSPQKNLILHQINYRESFIPLVEGQFKDEWVEEVGVQPLTSEAVLEAIEGYVGEAGGLSKDVYLRYMTSIRGLGDVLKGKGLLAIYLEYLPMWIEPLRERGNALEEEGKPHRRCVKHICRELLRHWYTKVAEETCQRLGIPEAEREEVRDGFVKDYQELSEELAGVMGEFGKGVKHLSREQLLACIEQGKEPREVMRRIEGVPLVVKEEKSGEGYTFSFQGDLLLNYLKSERRGRLKKAGYAALRLFESRVRLKKAMSKTRWKQDKLNSRELSRDEMKYMAERVKEEKGSECQTYTKELLGYVYQTREGEAYSVAGRNAMTILNYGGYNFSGQDFSGIRVPSADLSGGFFVCTNLHKVNLENVNAQGTDFSKADLSDTNIRDIHLSLVYHSAGFDDDVNIVSYSIVHYRPENSSELESWFIIRGNGYIFQMQNGEAIAKYDFYKYMARFKSDCKSRNDLKKKDLRFFSYIDKKNKYLLISIFYDSGYGRMSSIQVWSLDTKKYEYSLELDCRQYALLIINSNYLISGGEGHYIRLWNLNTKKNVRIQIPKIARGKDYKDDDHTVLSLEYNPHSNTLYTGHKGGYIGVWDFNDAVNDLASLENSNLQQKWILRYNALTFSEREMFGSLEDYLSLRTLSRMMKKDCFSGLNSYVLNLSIDVERKLLVAGCSISTHILDIDTGEEIPFNKNEHQALVLMSYNNAIVCDMKKLNTIPEDKLIRKLLEGSLERAFINWSFDGRSEGKRFDVLGISLNCKLVAIAGHSGFKFFHVKEFNEYRNSGMLFTKLNKANLSRITHNFSELEQKNIFGRCGAGTWSIKYTSSTIKTVELSEKYSALRFFNKSSFVYVSKEGGILTSKYKPYQPLQLKVSSIPDWTATNEKEIQILADALEYPFHPIDLSLGIERLDHQERRLRNKTIITKFIANPRIDASFVICEFCIGSSSNEKKIEVRGEYGRTEMYLCEILIFYNIFEPFKILLEHDDAVTKNIIKRDNFYLFNLVCEKADFKLLIWLFDCANSHGIKVDDIIKSNNYKCFLDACNHLHTPERLNVLLVYFSYIKKSGELINDILENSDFLKKMDFIYNGEALLAVIECFIGSDRILTLFQCGINNVFVNICRTNINNTLIAFNKAFRIPGLILEILQDGECLIAAMVNGRKDVVRFLFELAHVQENSNAVLKKMITAKDYCLFIDQCQVSNVSNVKLMLAEAYALGVDVVIELMIARNYDGFFSAKGETLDVLLYYANLCGIQEQLPNIPERGQSVNKNSENCALL